MTTPEAQRRRELVIVGLAVFCMVCVVASLPLSVVASQRAASGTHIAHRVEHLFEAFTRFSKTQCVADNAGRRVSNRRAVDVKHFMLEAARTRLAEAKRDPRGSRARKSNLRAARVYKRLALDFGPIALRRCR